MLSALQAGNVVTGEMVEELILSGADIIKVGIGPGGWVRLSEECASSHIINAKLASYTSTHTTETCYLNTLNSKVCLVVVLTL